MMKSDQRMLKSKFTHTLVTREQKIADRRTHRPSEIPFYVQNLELPLKVRFTFYEACKIKYFRTGSHSIVKPRSIACLFKSSTSVNYQVFDSGGIAG